MSSHDLGSHKLACCRIVEGERVGCSGNISIYDSSDFRRNKERADWDDEQPVRRCAAANRDRELFTLCWDAQKSKIEGPHEIERGEGMEGDGDEYTTGAHNLVRVVNSPLAYGMNNAAVEVKGLLM